MDNVNQNVWKKIGYDQSSERYTLENVGGSNSTNSSSDDGYIADEDRPKFIPYTPNTPAQIAAHNAKVAKDRENAWLAGQTNFYFFKTTPKKFLVFVYQLHPSNQTSFHNDQIGGLIVPPSFISSAMNFNKLVLARPTAERYFVTEPTMSDIQSPAMIWVKLENRYKYRIYVVSKDENLWQGWEVSAPRDNSNILINVNMTSPKSFPAPSKITTTPN